MGGKTSVHFQAYVNKTYANKTYSRYSNIFIEM